MKNFKKKDFFTDDTKIRYFSKGFNIHPMVIEYLLYKGYDTEKEIFDFLYPNREQFHSPFLLKEMKEAVIRILKALQKKEKILIFGDYDVDGITATTILLTALQKLHGNVCYRLPLRSEGYGLSSQAVKDAHENGISLIVTVDNGSSCHEAISLASHYGIDVVVTDHHEMMFERPPCYAFVNPKRSDNTYPFPELSGAGVALKVVEALFSKMPNFSLLEFIELAALGTLADVMPLIDENRAIVSLGIRKISLDPSPALKRLKERLSLPNINSNTLSFSIIPVLNSSGRVGNPNLAVHFLSQTEVDEHILETLILYNDERKKITSEQLKIAERRILLEKLVKHEILTIYDDFHDGIIGILASRIATKYNKPTIIISHEGKGSSRGCSIQNIPLIDIIQSESDLLLKFGGHQSAAGFSILEKNVPTFIEHMNQKKDILSKQKTIKEYDFEIPFHYFPKEALNDFQLLEPFGMKNEKPIFFSPNSYVDRVDIFGKYEKHLKFQTRKKEALCFFKGDEFLLCQNSKRFDVLYTFDTYDENKFFVQDFKNADCSLFQHVI